MNSNNIAKLQELGKVIKAVWTKRNNKKWEEDLEVAQIANDQITSLKVLQQYIGPVEYRTLLKEVKF